MSDELRPIWGDVDYWELRQLYEAHIRVNQYTYTFSQVQDMYQQAEKIDRWLRAEAYWKRGVESWLSAERIWDARKKILNGDPAYEAAEKGWQAMRQITNNLDGVDHFNKLSPILQDRYAVFAGAVLG